VQSKLGEVGEVAWEHLKKDIESSWDSLRAYANKNS
jgi:predicted RNA-binding protein with PUA-like domain